MSQNWQSGRSSSLTASNRNCKSRKINIGFGARTKKQIKAIIKTRGSAATASRGSAMRWQEGGGGAQELGKMFPL